MVWTNPAIVGLKTLTRCFDLPKTGLTNWHKPRGKFVLPWAVQNKTPPLELPGVGLVDPIGLG